VIAVDAQQLGLIGDALAAVPYIDYLAGRHGRGAWFIHDGPSNAFCPMVRPLLNPSLGFLFGGDCPCPAPTYTIDLGAAFRLANHKRLDLHMAQSYFALEGVGTPEVPITLPLLAEPLPPHPECIIVAPFSRSDYRNSKAWLPERWVETIHAILAADVGVNHAVILGSARAGAVDDTSPFVGRQWPAGTEVSLMLDEPLQTVLGALRSCRLFLSVDNGIAHLAHFGGVAHHAMLQPACLSENFVRNPRGRMIRGEPVKIMPPEMIQLAMGMLK
jgi:hypothetical protein